MSYGFYVRIDEEDKTLEQITQRERTYQAADVLRASGFPCRVIEYFTGDDKEANAAGIIIERSSRGARP